MALNRRMSRARYEVDLDLGDGFPTEISERAGRELIRVVQEALTNVRRHADARRVRVELGADGDLAYVEVTDDGRGFDTREPRTGVGQHSMRQRAWELGGELEVESEPGRGTRVRLTAPTLRTSPTRVSQYRETPGPPPGSPRGPFGVRFRWCVAL